MRGNRASGPAVTAVLWVVTVIGAACAAEPASKITAGEYNTKELLVLMDQDRNGKVSKQEFMQFMEAEFEALDTNGEGLLDVTELTGVRVRRSNPTNHK